MNIASPLAHIIDCDICADDEYVMARVSAYREETYEPHLTDIRNEISYLIVLTHDAEYASII